MALGCDTATKVTAARATTLKQNNITFVARYLNRVENVHDELTESEAKLISSNGMYVISIYQANGTVSANYFNLSNGLLDGERAYVALQILRPPKGYPVYFAVDFDATQQEITANLEPYFQGVFSQIDTSGYYMGIYGSKLVCNHFKRIYGSQLYTWIVDNSWQGTFNNWNLRQYGWDTVLGSGTGQIRIDYDESSSLGGGGWKM